MISLKRKYYIMGSVNAISGVNHIVRRNKIIFTIVAMSDWNIFNVYFIYG